ncbi:MAG: hypothetical protein QOH10_1915 [Actinomycetota bacterium]|jgi:hypothetical protein|nr:hypothetical protein [Actinomycetota bacterium]
MGCEHDAAHQRSDLDRIAGAPVPEDEQGGNEAEEQAGEQGPEDHARGSQAAPRSEAAAASDVSDAPGTIHGAPTW